MTEQERHYAGKTWMELCRRFRLASRNGDEEKRQSLSLILDGLESEFPEQVAAEQEFWAGK